MIEYLPAIVVLGAVVFDLVLGEPPSLLHPVVWIGTVTSGLRRTAPGRGVVRQLVWGVVVAVAVPALFTAGTVALLRWTSEPPWLAVLVGVALLKPCFAIRALRGAGLTVAVALASGDLAGARYHLRALCSRDASALSGSEVAAGAVESLAENTSDSVIAPLFYFALFGLPGAVAYRAINTLDAMLGYRGDLEYLGKAAARIDDLANLIPARLTAVLLLAAGALSRERFFGGLRILERDGGRTESPNAGRPMAVMAGLLGVALVKPGHYRLGDDDAPVTARTIRRAWRVCAIAIGLWVVIAAALAVFLRGGVA